VEESFIFSGVLGQKIDRDQPSKQYIDMSEDNLTKPKPFSYAQYISLANPKVARLDF
jgi:hypothetical protein